MIEPAMFVRMMLKRLDEQELTHFEALARGLKRKQYHHTCGRIAAINDLRDVIAELVKTGEEDDVDDIDPLTRSKKTWPSPQSTSTVSQDKPSKRSKQNKPSAS